MPTTVASPLPTVMSPVQASTMVTSSATTMPSITTSIQNLQQKDTTWTKLFVGGLPYHTTDKSLREHFEVYGEIEEAVVITDRSTGKSRGYGFVIMATKEAADRALKEPNPIIDQLLVGIVIQSRLQNKHQDLNENILKEKLKGFFDSQKRKLSTKKKKVMNLNI